MIKTIKINEYGNNKIITNKKESIEFLNPQKIFIPLLDNEIKYNSLVTEDDYVKVYQVIAKSEKFDIPIHSPISGRVISVNHKMWTNSGKLISCLVIENDFLEKKLFSDYILEELSREKILLKIKESGIIGMGGAGFPTYIKYQANDINTLIINCCECEPFITCDYRLIIEHPMKLINGIHYGLIATNAKKAIIAVKKYNKELIKVLCNYIDNKISVVPVPDKYPVGWERYLVYKIIKKKYDKIPSEVNCVVSNASTIVAINEAVKYNKPLIERMVTITGLCLKSPVNIYCKIGTNVDEILEYIDGFKKKYHKKHMIAGGVMTGKSIIDENLIVTKTLNSVIINPHLHEQEVFNCIGCGKCSYVCPSKLTPTEIHKYYRLKDYDELTKLCAQNCIQCGLCSYICPSRIDLSFFTLKAKDLVKRGKK